MPATAHINLKLDFNQVLDLVKQLPRKQQQQLASIISKEEMSIKKLTDKEEAFLNEPEESVDFANNYPQKKAATKKQVLDSITKGLQQVKLHQEGKIKLQTAQQLLDEL